MYRPIHVEAKDFQSFENLSYDFQSGKAILIEGENLTDDGQKTNGSGKSSFGEIIYYLLLGTSSTGKRDAKLVRWGQTQATISIVLENTYLKQTLEIKRSLFSNTKSSTLDISINGETLKNRYSSVAEGNKLILELLDISAEDLKNYFLVNRTRFVSFFDSADSAKRALLARFSNIDRLLSVIAKIDEEVRAGEIVAQEHERNKIAVQSKKELLEEQLKEKQSIDMYEQIKAGLTNEISSYESRIESIDSELAEVNKELAEVAKQYQSKEKEMEVLSVKIKALTEKDFEKALAENSKKRESLQSKIDELRNKKRDLENEMSEMNRELQPILVKLQSAITCPKCQHVFTLKDKDMNMDEAKAIVDEVQNYIKSLQSEVALKDKEVAELNNSRMAVQLEQERNAILAERTARDTEVSNIKRTQMFPITTAMENLMRVKNDKNSRVARLTAEREFNERELETAKCKLEQLTPQVEHPDIPRLKASIEAQDKSLAEIGTKVLEAEKTLSRSKSWKERMQQFYVYLTNKTLSVIEDRCNLYLKDIKSDLEIKLEGFKILANKSVKEAISASIARNGNEAEDYKCFSGGERGRATFSTILTFQQMINERSKSGGLDLLMIDEVLDQVDSCGMGLFIDSLEPLKKTIFIVSQVKTDAPVENTLTISKVNGISTIK